MTLQALLQAGEIGARVGDRDVPAVFRFEGRRQEVGDLVQVEFLAGAIIVGLIIFIPRWDSWMSKQEKKSSEPSISEEMKQGNIQ